MLRPLPRCLSGTCRPLLTLAALGAAFQAGRLRPAADQQSPAQPRPLAALKTDASFGGRDRQLAG